MANGFWNFVTQFVPNTLAKAEDVNTNFSGVSAGFDLVEAQTLQSIKVTDTPGVINISSTPANRANKIVSFDGTGGVLATIYIGNYRGNHAVVAGTVYNVRDTVKDSTGALGQDNIYICNTSHTSTGDLAVDVANWDILVDVAAVAASAAAALVSENNAAASFTSFDNRYLGAKAADPTLDNSGGALIDGATYFDTTLNRMKVYDLGTTTWLLTTANAVDVNIADAGNFFTGVEAETALQESMTAIYDPVTSAGTTSLVTTAFGLGALVTGRLYRIKAHATYLAGATLNVDVAGAKAILLVDGVTGFSLNDILINGVYDYLYNGTAFLLLNPENSLLAKNNLSDLDNTGTARTNLNVDVAGTDNSTDVTLAGLPNYLTVVGQVITRALINLTSHVTGLLPIASGGTNAGTAAAGLANLGGAALAGATFTGAVRRGDNISSFWGAGDDFVITHSGANTEIQAFTGNIDINNRVSGGLVRILTDDASSLALAGVIIGGAIPVVKIHANGILESESVVGAFNIVNQLQIASVAQLTNDSIAVANFTQGSTVYVLDDSPASAIFDVNLNMLGGGVYESIGPTGSGASNTWTALDAIPLSAVWLECKIRISAFHSGGTQANPSFAVRRFGLLTSNVASTVASCLIQANGNGANALAANNVTTFRIALDASNRFEGAWSSIVGTGNGALMTVSAFGKAS